MINYNCDHFCINLLVTVQIHHYTAPLTIMKQTINIEKKSVPGNSSGALHRRGENCRLVSHPGTTFFISNYMFTNIPLKCKIQHKDNVSLTDYDTKSIHFYFGLAICVCSTDSVYTREWSNDALINS